MRKLSISELVDDKKYSVSQPDHKVYKWYISGIGEQLRSKLNWLREYTEIECARFVSLGTNSIQLSRLLTVVDAINTR